MMTTVAIRSAKTDLAIDASSSVNGGQAMGEMAPILDQVPIGPDVITYRIIIIAAAFYAGRP